MERKILFSDKSLYRDDFRVTAFHFGSEDKTVCIVGSTRGNENQQLFTCAMLIKELERLEAEGKLNPGYGITVIPCCNPYSINIRKRFWPIDNTDINRMFPGYDQGETTQRIAAGIFDAIKEYRYGIQMSSYYLKGEFIPHVRLMDTGYQDLEAAKDFGLEFVLERTPRPYDTTTLNYNWQIWDCSAFSLFTEETQKISPECARSGILAILRFLSRRGFIKAQIPSGFISQHIHGDSLLRVRSTTGGIYERRKGQGDRVEKGEVMGRIVHPYEGTVLEEILSPATGRVFFAHRAQLAMAQEMLFQVIEEETY